MNKCVSIMCEISAKDLENNPTWIAYKPHCECVRDCIALKKLIDFGSIEEMPAFWAEIMKKIVERS